MTEETIEFEGIKIEVTNLDPVETGKGYLFPEGSPLSVINKFKEQLVDLETNRVWFKNPKNDIPV